MDKYVKAVVGAIIAGAGAIGTAVADGHVTATEWVLVVSAIAAGFGAVWASPKNAEPTKESA